MTNRAWQAVATVAAIWLAGASAAHANLVTSISGGTAIPEPIVGYSGSASQTFGNNVTWSVSGPYGGAFGSTGGFGFGSNGQWNLNTNSIIFSAGYSYSTQTFTFNNGPVQSVGAILNFAPDGSGNGITLSAFDVNGHLLESSFVTFDNHGIGDDLNNFYGFSESSALIASFSVSGYYEGVTGLQVVQSQSTPAPEPASLVLFATGLALAGQARRRKSARRFSFAA